MTAKHINFQYLKEKDCFLFRLDDIWLFLLQTVRFVLREKVSRVISYNANDAGHNKLFQPDKIVEL